MSYTVTEGGIVSVAANRTTCNTIETKGNITLQDGAILQLSDGNFEEAPYHGTTYRVFSTTGTISGFFDQIDPSTPGEGQTWDVSELYTKGVIKVVGGEDNPDGITSVQRDTESVRQEYYNLSGSRILSPADGIYIMRTTQPDGKTVAQKVIY